MSEKKCRDCGLVKPVTEFWKRKASEDGLALYCKECFGLRNAAAMRRRAAKEGRSVRPYRRWSATPEGMRYCPRCEKTKEAGEFVQNRTRSSGLSSYCKACWPEIVRENKRRNHGSERNFRLKLRYRLTEEEVDAHLRLQGGVCVICLRSEGKHVDHDHMTGLFRAVLCFGCNGALGQYEDDPWRMRESADYLEGRSSHSRLMMIELGALTIARGMYRTTWTRGQRSTSRDYRLRARYGVQEASVEAMLRVQRDLCAVCCDRSAENVDHDHGTGEIRGVLCGGCNTGMGQLGDDPVALRRAADHVQGRLIRRVPSEGGGERFSFTWPDVDPATVRLDGWGRYRALDGERRRLFLEFEERAFEFPGLRIARGQDGCHRRPARPGSGPLERWKNALV